MYKGKSTKMVSLPLNQFHIIFFQCSWYRLDFSKEGNQTA